MPASKSYVCPFTKHVKKEPVATTQANNFLKSLVRNQVMEAIYLRIPSIPLMQVPKATTTKNLQM